jgi:hypothetical protein
MGTTSNVQPAPRLHARLGANVSAGRDQSRKPSTATGIRSTDHHQLLAEKPETEGGALAGVSTGRNKGALERSGVCSTYAPCTDTPATRVDMDGYLTAVATPRSRSEPARWLAVVRFHRSTARGDRLDRVRRFHGSRSIALHSKATVEAQVWRLFSKLDVANRVRSPSWSSKRASPAGLAKPVLARVACWVSVAERRATVLGRSAQGSGTEVPSSLPKLSPTFAGRRGSFLVLRGAKEAT